MARCEVFCWVLCAALWLGCEQRSREDGTAAARAHDKRTRKPSSRTIVETRRLPLTNQTALRLDLEYAGGYLDVFADTSGLLADLRFEFEQEENRPEIIFDSTSTRPTLSIQSYRSHRDNTSFNELRDTRWLLGISPQVVLDFRLEAGAFNGRLDFSGLRVDNISIQVGAGELDLAFDKPNPERSRIDISAGAASTTATGLAYANFSSFEFQGGAGKSTLIFDGDYAGEGEVRLKYGVGLNTVFLAPDLGVKIRKEGSFLAPMSLHGFDKDGEMYYSKNYAQAQGRLEFEIKMGVGHTTVKWLD